MNFTRRLIQPVSAQTDSNTHPTIPYVPPGNPTPTVTVTTTVTTTPVDTGPYFYLTSDKNSYSIQETGKISVHVDSKGEAVKEFKIIIEYDPTHIEVLDSDAVVSGIQVDFIDSVFETLPDGNKVETDIVGSESGLPGRITIHADTGSAAAISDRVVADIQFRVLAAKTSELTISKNLSTILDGNNVDKLDSDALDPFVINSSGVTQPTPTSSIPRPTTTPDTAISSPEGMLFAIGGTLLIISGLFLRKKVKQSSR